MLNRVSLLLIFLLAGSLFPYLASAAPGDLSASPVQSGTSANIDGSDDSFEENDTHHTAASLQAGLYTHLACLDDDWYHLRLDEEATLTIAVAFSHAHGNIDMQLLWEDGSTKLTEATTRTDNEHIRIPRLSAGNYLLRVYSPQQDSNDYGLAIVLNDVGLFQLENTDNDWYLPAGTERDSDSGFFRFGLENPSPRFPILANAGNTWSWKQLNPEEGVYRFDLIQEEIDKLQGTPYLIALRIRNSAREAVPDWVVQKHNPPIATFKGWESFEIDYVATWHTGVESEFFKFLSALSQTGIPQNPKVAFAYIQAVCSGRAEELYFKGNDLSIAEQQLGFSPQVYRDWANRRIDAWADAFQGVEHKLMWVGDEESLKQTRNGPYHQADMAVVAHALERGISFRGGIIEAYYGSRIKPASTGQGLVRDPYGKTNPYYETYFYTDLDFPVIAEHRASGDENEAYWSDTTKWKDSPEQRKHRWLMSNLRSLSMNFRFLYSTDFAYSIDPTFSDYVLKSLGKTVYTSRDAWVFLNEGYRTYYIDGKWRDVSMKNFERYLYQRDVPGARTVAVEKMYRNKAGGENMQDPPWGTGTPFDFTARRTDSVSGNDRIYFNVEDRFIHGQPQTVLLRVTYKDVSTGQWHAEYDAGPDGILSTPAITGTGDGQWKTATFALGRAAFAGQLSYEQDLAIVADDGDVTIKYVRIIKWSQPDATQSPIDPLSPTPVPTDTPTVTPTAMQTSTTSSTPTAMPTNAPTPEPIPIPATETPILEPATATPTLMYSPTLLPTATPIIIRGESQTFLPVVVK